MQFRTVAVIAFLSALSSAQSLPACAEPCFTAAAQNVTVCQPTDTVCICTTGKSQFTQLVTPCVISSCSASDQAQVAPAAAALCLQAESSGSGSSSVPASTGSAKSTGSMSSTKTGASTTATASMSSSSSAAMAMMAPAAGFGTVFGLVAAGLMLL